MDEETLLSAVEELIKRDDHLREVVARYGSPPLWAREPGFPTLVKIILEQQVSLSSAQAAYDKLWAAVDKLTPEAFLTLNDVDLKQVGFSRQKTRYCKILAESLISGDLDLDSLAWKNDVDVFDALTCLKGIGPWTASIYLLMALRRPDVWPRGDLALLVSLQEVKGLDSRPTLEEAAAIADDWIPWRSVAARVLWHSYLCRRG